MKWETRIKRMLALTCAALIMLPTAYADMAYRTPVGEAYIGESNRIYIAGDEVSKDKAAQDEALVMDIIGADEENIYFMGPGGMLDGEVHIGALLRWNLNTAKSELIAENVLSAAYLPGSGAVYYVTADERMQIKAYPASVRGYTMRTDVQRLQASTQGLIVTAGGSDGLYLKGIGVLELPKEDQGAEYRMINGAFDVITGANGELWIRPIGDHDKVLLAENTIASAYDAQQDKLYFVAGEEPLQFLHKYDPVENKTEKLQAALQITSERMVAADGVLYILDEKDSLNAYYVETGEYKPLADFSKSELVDPLLAYGNGCVLLYDKMLGMDLFADAIRIVPEEEIAKETYTTLKRGSRGDAVTRLQQRLIDLNYLTDKADGIFGALTQEAVELLQAELELEETGIADEDFQKLIYTTSIEPLELYAEIKDGSRGTAVRKMQERLRNLQYLAGKADGIFGARTEAAVEAYQKQHGFKVNGVADEDLLVHLYSKNATECAGYIELKKNDTGAMVKELHERLKELYYTSEKATYTYGNATVQAVKLFQQQMGLEANGIATPELQQMIFSEYAQAYGGYADHFAGEADERILAAQMRLIELGYLRKDVHTGCLDAVTMQAIRDFQYEHGLGITGELSAQTQQWLFDGIARSAPEILTETELAAVLAHAGRYFANPISDYDIMVLLQERLISLNYLSSKVTAGGVYNRLTSEAVKRLQLSLGLVNVSTSLDSLGKLDTITVDILIGTPGISYDGTPAYYYN